MGRDSRGSLIADEGKARLAGGGHVVDTAARRLPLVCLWGLRSGEKMAHISSSSSPSIRLRLLGGFSPSPSSATPLKRACLASSFTWKKGGGLTPPEQGQLTQDEPPSQTLPVTKHTTYNSLELIAE